MKDFQYFAPKDLSEALDLFRRYGNEAKALAGEPDLLLRTEEKVIIDLNNIEELKRIEPIGNGVIVGALVLLDEIASSPLIRERWRILSEGAAAAGSVQTRNRATLGGSLCDTSPAADTASPLLALAARARITSSKGEREIPLEAFFRGPGRNSLEPGEILKEVFIPSLPARTGSSFHRLTRAGLDTAIVNCAATLTLSPTPETVEDIRIGLGAAGPVPLRATEAETFFMGETPSAKTIEEAANLAALAAKPVEEARASAEYRDEMIRALARLAIQEALGEARARS